MRNILLSLTPALIAICLTVAALAADTPAPPKTLTIRRDTGLHMRSQERTFQVIQASRSQKGAEPGIDLTKETVLFVAMGMRNTGGYRITIDEAQELADRVNVYVTESSPGPDQMVTMAFSWPSDVAAIPKVSKPVYFIVQAAIGRQKQGEPVTIYPVLQSFQGTTKAREKREMLVIRDAEAWKKLWTELTAGEVPALDFKQVMAIAVISEPQTTHAPLAIAQVQESGEKLLVSLAAQPTFRVAPAVINGPARVGEPTGSYAIAVIAASAKEVVFTTKEDRPRKGEKVLPMRGEGVGH